MLARQYQLSTSRSFIHKTLTYKFLGRRLFMLSASVQPRSRNPQYRWTLNGTRSWISTRPPYRLLPEHLGGHGLGVIVPFFDYEDVILVSRIETFLHNQTSLEQDLRGLDLGPLLGMAIETQKQDVVRFLLKKGADPNGWSYAEPISHLAQAAKFENLEVVKLLLNHGACPSGCGALWEAAKAGNIAAADVLISRGVDVNEIISPKICEGLDPYKDTFRISQLKNFMKDSQQGTPLHAACMYEEADMIEFLLSMGANKNIQNEEGEVAASIAEDWFCSPLEDYDGCMSIERRYQICDMLTKF